MTVTVGAWIIPLFITIGSFVLAGTSVPKRSGDYDFGSGLVGLIYLAGAAIVSLISWLIWALL